MKVRLRCLGVMLLLCLGLLSPNTAIAQIVHFGSESTSDKNAYDGFIAEGKVQLARLLELKAAVRRDLERGDYDPGTYIARSELAGVARLLRDAGAQYVGADRPAPHDVVERKMREYDEKIRAAEAEIARLEEARRGGPPPGQKSPMLPAVDQTIELKSDCIDVLQDHDERLRIAGAAKSLLAWSPLLLMMGEANAAHLSFTVATMPWEELSKSIGAADKLVYSQLATEARIHAEQHQSDPSLRAFWVRLSESYAVQIDPQ